MTSYFSFCSLLLLLCTPILLVNGNYYGWGAPNELIEVDEDSGQVSSLHTFPSLYCTPRSFSFYILMYPFHYRYYVPYRVTGSVKMQFLYIFALGNATTDSMLYYFSLQTKQVLKEFPIFLKKPLGWARGTICFSELTQTVYVISAYCNVCYLLFFLKKKII